MKTKMTTRQFVREVLNGVAVGIVVVLIPGAILNELVKLLLPVFPQGQFILNATSIATYLMSMAIGVGVSMQFKLGSIQMIAVALAAVLGSGAIQVNEASQFVFAGSGDIINAALTSMMAVGLVLLLGNRFKAYTMLLLPALVITLAGGAGAFLLPYVRNITLAVSQGVSYLLELQPYLMSMLMAVVFSLIIVSPISTVAIAIAISLSGVGAAAANLGVCAAGFGLAVNGWRVNNKGTNIALVMGSPKMQMPNALSKPKIMIPIVINAAVCGLVGALLGFQGTPMSAGFGVSGLIGPINAINLAPGGWIVTNIVPVVLTFIVLPIVLGWGLRYVFTKKVALISEEDYRLEFK